MSREWKSGDVAMVCAKAGGIARAEVAWLDPDECWIFADGAGCHSSRSDLVEWVRPLVLLDPENYQSLLSMVQAMEVHRPGQDITAATDRLQDHLRLIANPKPPRIDEPGTWAVVEASCVHDETARRWVKFPGGNWHTQVTFGQHRSIDNPDDWDSLIDPVLVRDGVDQ